MPRVILVSGARFLESIPGAKAWVIDAVFDVVRALRPDTLVVGDASGPDAWVRGVAHALLTPIPAYVYHAQTGEIVRWVDGEPEEVGTWMPSAVLSTIEPAMRPLWRNQRMVQHVARRDPDGMCAAFVAPDPRRTTRGTEHTLGLARVAGLTTRTWLWGFSSARADGVMPEALARKAETA